MCKNLRRKRMGSLYENSTIYDDDDDHHHDLISTLDNNYHHYYQQNDEHHHHRRHHQKQQQQATYSSSSSGRSQHHHHHTRTTRTWKIHVFSQRWSNISILLLLLSLTLTLQVTISSCSPLRGNEANFYPRSYLQHHQNRFQRHLKPSNMLQDNLGENTFTNLDSSASLSIVSPLDILRQNLLLEIHRQRLRHAKTKQVESNREILEKIG